MGRHIIDKDISRLTKQIKSIPEYQRAKGSELAGFFKSLGVQFPLSHVLNLSDDFKKLKFVFKPVQTIFTCDQYPLCASSGVNLVVVMPAANFVADDFLGFPYFLKRAYFISILAYHLARQSSTSYSVSFQYQKRSSIKPILVLKSLEHDLVINVIPCIEYDQKLLASLNNHMPNIPLLEYVQHDLSIANFVTKAKQTLSNVPLLETILRLLKGWTKILNLETINGFMLTCLAVYLYNRGLISSLMNEIQLLRTLLKFISEFPTDSLESLQDLKALDKLTDIFKSLDLPCIYSIGTVEFSQFANCCQKLLDYLETYQDYKINFDSCLPILNQCDMTIRLPISSTTIAAKHQACLELFMDNLESVLRQSLTNRIQKIFLWSTNNVVPVPVNTESNLEHEVTIGLVFNAKNYNRIADFGPLVEDKVQCEEFRKFWGSKAELRRLTDGTLCESVVWKDDCKKDSLVISTIISYIFELHFGIAAINFSQQLDSYLPVSNFSGHGASSTRLLGIFRRIRHLPLSIVNCELVSSNSFMAQYYPLAPLSGKGDNPLRYIPVTDIMIEVENSSHWPSDQTAANLVKQAFCIHLAQKVKREAANVECRVSTSFLDVLFEGYYFRCKLTCESERRQSPNVNYELTYCKGLQSVAVSFKAFGPTCRIVKKWIGSQMLSLQFTDALIHLLVAYLFVGVSTNLAPNSTWTGFYQFLYMLAHADFSVPLVLRLPNSKQQSTTTLDANVTCNFSICFLTGIEGPQTPSIFSMSKEQLPILVEARRQATAALNVIQVSKPGSNYINVMFKRSLKAFDDYMELSPEYIYRNEDGELTINPTKQQFFSKMPGFDPIECLLSDLKNKFGTMVEFYYDVNGGKVIGMRKRETRCDFESIKVFSSEFLLARNASRS